MTEELMTLAKLFRITASQLRRLAEGPIRHDNRSLVVIEGYFYKNQLRGAAAFPSDQCLETANRLEEFAVKLAALGRPKTEPSLKRKRGRGS
jgi:hypothetical protein